MENNKTSQYIAKETVKWFGSSFFSKDLKFVLVQYVCYSRQGLQFFCDFVCHQNISMIHIEVFARVSSIALIFPEFFS